MRKHMLHVLFGKARRSRWVSGQAGQAAAVQVELGQVVELGPQLAGHGRGTRRPRLLLEEAT